MLVASTPLSAFADRGRPRGARSTARDHVLFAELQTSTTFAAHGTRDGRERSLQRSAV
jgi:hypothetical protein